MTLPVFVLLAVPLVLAALGVILQRNPVRSALCLVMALFFLAVGHAALRLAESLRGNGLPLPDLST